MNRQLEMNRVQKETHTHSASGFRRKVSLQFKEGKDGFFFKWC